jgi:hypothetical protein
MAHVVPLYVRFVGPVPRFQFQSIIVPGHVPPPELELLELLDDALLELLELLELLDDELEDALLETLELLDDELVELLETSPLLLEALAPALPPWPLDPPLPIEPPAPPFPDELPGPADVHSSSPSSLGAGSWSPVAQAPKMPHIAAKIAIRGICKSITNPRSNG